MNRLLIRCGMGLSNLLTSISLRLHKMTKGVTRINSRLLDYLIKRADDL